MSKSQNKGTAIVLNRMYVGDYLSTNLGHEVINMFQADNGNHYIYLNSRGNLAEEHKGKVGFMLLVKYHTKGEVEVIGKAVGLEEVPGSVTTLARNKKNLIVNISEEQKAYIKQEQITYGKHIDVDGNGKPLLDIFKDAEQQNIFITYKAQCVYRAKKNTKIIIRFSNTENTTNQECVIQLDGYKQAKASLKQYIYPGSNDYDALMGLINEGAYWDDTIQLYNTEINCI